MTDIVYNGYITRSDTKWNMDFKKKEEPKINDVKKILKCLFSTKK